MLNPENKRRRMIKRYRLASVFLLLLLSLWVGYQLANIERSYYQGEIENLEQTVANLNEQYNSLTQGVNQREARIALCEAETTVLQESVKTAASDLSACEANIALYQHVMAPELSGDMLSVSVLAIEPEDDSENVFTISLVLLQPRLQKAVVSGELAISLIFSDDTVSSPVETLTYRFKFFQQNTVSITVPSGMTPKALLLTSEVTQYRRVRESLRLEIPWKLGSTDMLAE